LPIVTEGFPKINFSEGPRLRQGYGGARQGEWKTWPCILFDFWYNMANAVYLTGGSMFEDYHRRFLIFISEETKKMSDKELLAALKDLHGQWDDYGLCFDVESYDRELKAEKSRRGL